MLEYFAQPYLGTVVNAGVASAGVGLGGWRHMPSIVLSFVTSELDMRGYAATDQFSVSCRFLLAKENCQLVHDVVHKAFCIVQRNSFVVAYSVLRLEKASEALPVFVTRMQRSVRTRQDRQT